LKKRKWERIKDLANWELGKGKGSGEWGKEERRALIEEKREEGNGKRKTKQKRKKYEKETVRW